MSKADQPYNPSLSKQQKRNLLNQAAVRERLEKVGKLGVDIATSEAEVEGAEFGITKTGGGTRRRVYIHPTNSAGIADDIRNSRMLKIKSRLRGSSG